MIDPKITNAMVAWLHSDHSSDEAIRKGAQILIRVNRNRGLYERIIRQPQRGLKKLEYEIKKHVNMRLDGYSIEDVLKLNNDILPKVNTDIYQCEKLDRELQKVDNTEFSIPDGKGGAVPSSKGIRPDHDQLPAEIQAIWPANAERWKKIKATFELLKTIDAPCDRYEHLKLLKETWYKYKAEMARYDDFKAAADDGGSKGLDENEQKMVDYAHSFISKNLPVLLELVEEAKEPDFDKTEQLEEKRVFIQDRVNILLKAGVQLSDQRKADLVKCDIAIELPADDAEGEGSE